jgi:adenylate cyclase
MNEERAQRHLAAILAADVVGYSRLMERDEAATLAALKALRSEVFEPQMRAHGGRIFKIAGDGALCEFASAVDAVRAALEVQRALAERNAGLPGDRRIALRIGIALGDVIAEGGDLYGHGVNLAARIEGLCEPGGVCVAANVAEHLQTAGGFVAADLGEHPLKNIERPIRAFRVAVAHGPEAGPKRPTLALPDKPSIAVLPFQNMSGDPEQDYFADGMVEDIIMALSRIRWLFVIARNSSFTYKGKAVDVASAPISFSPMAIWIPKRCGSSARFGNRRFASPLGGVLCLCRIQHPIQTYCEHFQDIRPQSVRVSATRFGFGGISRARR